MKPTWRMSAENSNIRSWLLELSGIESQQELQSYWPGLMIFGLSSCTIWFKRKPTSWRNCFNEAFNNGKKGRGGKSSGWQCAANTQSKPTSVFCKKERKKKVINLWFELKCCRTLVLNQYKMMNVRSWVRWYTKKHCKEAQTRCLCAHMRPLIRKTRPDWELLANPRERERDITDLKGREGGGNKNWIQWIICKFLNQILAKGR